MRGEALISYLHNENVRKFALKTEFFKGKNADYASDFDIFSAICDSISLFAGNYIRNDLFSILYGFVPESIDSFFLYSEKNRKEIWQRIFYEDLKPFPQVDKIDKNEKDFDIDVSHLIIFEKDVDIKSLVDLNSSTVFDALDKALDKIKAEDITIITFDVRKLKYSRPDDFHASESYKCLTQGGDGDVFLLWLLCRIFMKVDLELRLVVNSSIDAQRIVELLASVRVSPKVYICFDMFKKAEYEKLVDIVLKNYKKNISLEIEIPKEIDKNILSVILKEMFEIIPLAFICIRCDVIDKFSKALEIALYDILDLHERAALLNALCRAK